MRRILLGLVPGIVAFVAGSRTASAQFVFDSWNESYNTDIQTQKYTPVRNTAIHGDEALCKGAIAARGTHLGAMSRIEFFSDRPNEVLAPEQIPMVVITGGRAKFLARNLRRPLPPNPSDLNAVEYWNDWLPGSSSDVGKGVVLWYDDRRTQRPLYLIVDYREYAYYYLMLHSKLLNDDNRKVRLVGCRIVAEDGSSDAVGFGAQRVCAVEWMKRQNREFAWILDDNIATLKGLTRLDEVEERMRKERYLAVSFNPDNTRQADHWTTREEIAKQIEQGTHVFDRKEEVIRDAGPGDNELMQQAVLWNIRAIRDRGLTFSPYFVESAEDLTFTRYLKTKNSVLKLVKGVTVVKITGDNSWPYGGEETRFAERFAGYAAEALQRTKAKHSDADNAIQFKLGEAGLPIPVGAFVQTLPHDPVAGPTLGLVRVTTDKRGTDGRPVEPPAVTARKIVENTLLYCLGAHPTLFEPMFTSPPKEVVSESSPLRTYSIGQKKPALHPPHADVANIVIQERLFALRFSILYAAARVQLLHASLSDAALDSKARDPLLTAARTLIDTSAAIRDVRVPLTKDTMELLKQLVLVALPQQLGTIRQQLVPLRDRLAARPELGELDTQLTELDTALARLKTDLETLDLLDFLTN